MVMKVKEVADLVGVSVRTLHHYDQIGLLMPKETSDSGYRLYSENELEKLQQILFFKKLDFPLKEIKRIMSNPSLDQHEVLTLQRKMLMEERKRVDKMIETIDKTIKHMEKEVYITMKERFEGINFKSNQYEEEARLLWGDKSIDETNAKLKNLGKDEEERLSENWDRIFAKLLQLIAYSPESTEVQEAIKEWYDFLNENFGKYSLEAFYGLGQLYIQDERFTQNIDKYGEGLAKFMSEAMEIFSINQMK